MGSYGMKISLPGYDVLTATPEQCAVHTGYNSPKVDLFASPAHFGTIRVTFANNPPNLATTTLYTIPHGLGYTPIVQGSGKFADFSSEYSGTMPMIPSGTIEMHLKSDATNVYLTIYYESAWGSIIGNTLTVTYYIFAEEGA